MHTQKISLFLLLLSAVVAQAQEGNQKTPSAASIPATTLKSLLEDVLKSNPSLEIYSEDVNVSKAEARVAGRLEDPVLSLEGGRKKVSGVDNDPSSRGPVWLVNYSQNIGWPGRLAAKRAVGQKKLQSSHLEFSRLQVELKATTCELAYKWYYEGEKIKALQEVADRFLSLQETLAARQPVGIVPLLETRIIEAAELEKSTRLAKEKADLQTTLAEIGRLRNKTDSASFEIEKLTLKFPQLPADNLLLEGAKQNNIERQLLQARYEELSAALKLARNEQYPDISVSPFVENDTSQGRETTVGLGVSMPLPVSGKARANVQVAQSHFRQAEITLGAYDRNLELQVKTLAAAINLKTSELQKRSPEVIQRIQETADLADRQYRLGAIPVTTYIETQNSYLESLEAILESQAETLSLYLRLEKLTGLNLNPLSEYL